MFKIVNAKDTDHHIHSSSFSDGLNTIEEIVEYAGVLNLKEITITDHSQVDLDHINKEYNVKQSTFRYNLYRYKNILNNVNVNFGVEADLLDERGNVCTHIQGIESDKIILSAHYPNYHGNLKNINDAYENAIIKYKEKIICIGHPFLQHKYDPKDFYTNEHLDVKRLCEFANKHRIALEINGSNLSKGRENEKQLKEMLERAKYIMVNSDAHCLYEMKCNINFAYGWLREKGFL